MAKTNFTKVEEALTQGLLKMTIQHLIGLADAAAAIGKKSTKVYKSSSQQEEAQSHALEALQQELKRLHKKDRSMYSKLGINRKELKSYLQHPELLKPEEWEKVKQIREKIQAYRKESRQNFPQESNELLIESERHKHINKRFNVNDKWLPLT